MWSPLHLRWRIAIVTFILFLCITLLFKNSEHISSSSSPTHLNAPDLRTSLGFSPSPDELQANATLGFQKIVAVSGEDPSGRLAWRRKGLIAAANRTGLLLHIEETHKLSDAEVDFVHNITLKNGKNPGGGSAMAWAAHTRVLRQMVNERVTSALILEDDIDWEVDVKKQLAPSGDLATAVRRLSASNPQLEFTSLPYGNTYDVLWLGHCGMRWHGNFGPTTFFNITYRDPLVFPMKTYAVWDGKPLEGVPEGHRQVRLGSEVLCTLAYGITLQGAERLLHRLDNGGGHGAFDIELTDACAYGNLRCLTVNPELMHDQVMQGGQGSLINSKKPGSAKKYEDMIPVTWNIRYSARCNAGFEPGNLQQCLSKRQKDV